MKHYWTIAEELQLKWLLPLHLVFLDYNLQIIEQEGHLAQLFHSS